MIDLPISDVSARFRDHITESARRANNARTARDRRFHRGRESAFREALELLDVSLRSQSVGHAVPLRNSHVIMNEEEQ